MNMWILLIFSIDCIQTIEYGAGIYEAWGIVPSHGEDPLDYY